jgi:hypothetical protein
VPPREAEQPSTAGPPPTTRTQDCQPQPKPTKAAGRESFWDLPSNLVIIEAKNPSVLDTHRSSDFLIADPDLIQYQKPMDRFSTATQRFTVELYQHYTRERLLRRNATNHDHRYSGKANISCTRQSFY